MSRQSPKGKQEKTSSQEYLRSAVFRYTCRITAPEKSGQSDRSSNVEFTRELLGGKGYGLREMALLDLPVPPGFILTTEACRAFLRSNETLPNDIQEEILAQIALLEQETGLGLGNANRPLFVSARSGAPISMPGAMDTILNIGINDETVEVLAHHIGREAAMESYRRLVIDFASSAFGIEKAAFAESHTAEEAKRFFAYHTGMQFPQDALTQLKFSLDAVFRSWNSPLAQLHRQENAIPDTLGTAAVVQQMVWGNSSRTALLSGSGVMLTHPETDFSHEPAIDFAPGRQGVDVVDDSTGENNWRWRDLPQDLCMDLQGIADKLENHHRWPQDVEFTLQNGKLWVLQTRKARLSPLAEFRFYREVAFQRGWITEKQIARRLSPAQLRPLLVPDLDPEAKLQAESEGRVLSHGMPITQGSATGSMVTSLEEARAAESRPVIFFGGKEFSQEVLLQLQKLGNVVGIVAESGSLGSHLSRTAMHIGLKRHIPIILGARLLNGDAYASAGNPVTVDGTDGTVYLGSIPRTLQATARLSAEEKNDVEYLLNLRHENPWAFLTDAEDIPPFEDQAQQLTRSAQKNFSSPKAHETTLMELFPAEMRIEYTPLRKQHQWKIRQALKHILRRGDSDATMRTCHTPPQVGGSPWVLLTNESDIDRFFEDAHYSPKHGGYPRWEQDPELTEVIIGKIPKDKLNTQPEIARQHCAWTLTANETGVILQISPFTSQLRSFETGTRDDFITITATYDSRTGSLRIDEPSIGENLLTEESRDESTYFAQLVGNRVLNEWWTEYQLAARVAAVGTVLSPAEGFSEPVLEGQARVRNGELAWCKMYGLKVDKQENGNGNGTHEKPVLRLVPKPKTR